MAHPRTVLLFDSDEDSRLIYATVLRYHGMEVLESASARSAVEAARSARPGVVVLELSLSSGPGWEVAASLRGAAETAAIPLLALSSTGLPEHRERALGIGCAAFLVKPLPPQELVREVRRVLQCEEGRG